MKLISKLASMSLLCFLTINIYAQNNEPNISSNVLIEEVVVTARKKEESAQNVPVALTAMNQEQLEILKFRDFNDLAVGMPNVAMDDIGIHLGYPDLVSGRFISDRSKSICDQVKEHNSPRLMPVSMAKTTTGQTCGFWVSIDASSSLLYSPSFNRLSLGLSEGGFLIWSTGLTDNLNPHSLIAILKQCLMRMRSS